MLGVKRIERVLPTGTSLTVVGEVWNYHFSFVQTAFEIMSLFTKQNYGKLRNLMYYLGSITNHIISLIPVTTFTYVQFKLKSVYVEND